jgi:hypothetical protein
VPCLELGWSRWQRHSWGDALQPAVLDGVWQSGAINDAVRLGEAIHINLSLLALQVGVAIALQRVRISPTTLIMN